MRHRKGFNHLGRKKGHRRAMLANMGSSLIKHKRITTTLAKAKALRSYIEPLITKSKNDETHSRRVVFSYLQDKEATAELFREVSPKIAERPGGYTRIIKLPTRLGDSADMAMIELVDFNELLVKEAKPKKARRSRRGGKKADAGIKSVAASEAKVEEPKADKAVSEEVVEAPVEVKPEETPDVEETPKEEKSASDAEAKAEETPDNETPKDEEDGEEKKDA